MEGLRLSQGPECGRAFGGTEHLVLVRPRELRVEAWRVPHPRSSVAAPQPALWRQALAVQHGLTPSRLGREQETDLKHREPG